MRRSCSAHFLSFVLAAGAVVQAQHACLSDFTDIPSVKRDGEKVAREVSGATYCQGRMWVVDNEDDQNLLVMEDNGSFSAHPLPSDGRISDLEGITSNGKSLYVIAGGGLSKESRVKPKRFAMARVTLNHGEPTEVRIVDMLKWLVPVAQELGMEMEKAEGPDGKKMKVPKDGKFEGLAMMPDGRLLMGIRKPLVENLAVILQLDGYKEAFDQEKASLIQPKLVAELDLDGGGISSLEYDPDGKRLLILGIHAKKNRTDLYAWKEDAGKKGKPKRICKIKGHKAEGVVRDEDSHRILILCDDEDPNVGRYTFLEE
jgi:hypothetical protein